MTTVSTTNAATPTQSTTDARGVPDPALTSGEALANSPTAADRILLAGVPQSEGWVSVNDWSLFGREFAEQIYLSDDQGGYRAFADVTVSKEFDGTVLRVSGESFAREYNPGDGVPDQIYVQEWITVTFDDGRSMDFQISGELGADGGGAGIGGGTSWEPVVNGDYKTIQVTSDWQSRHDLSSTISLPAGADGNDVATFQYKMNATFVEDGDRVSRSIMSPPLRVN